MTDKPTCETCPYWDPVEGEEEDGGDCRRHPPAYNLDDPGQPSGGWLMTDPKDWCAEHPRFFGPRKMETEGEWRQRIIDLSNQIKEQFGD